MVKKEKFNRFEYQLPDENRLDVQLAELAKALPVPSHAADTEHFLTGLSEMNYFNHRTALPDFYWTADTRMNCLRAAVGQSLKYAYAHHIQRLMVTGNFALLAGIHPDAVDEWYLGIYIDAIQWVELPNTRAMSQYADGGRVATKPYVSTARYIRTMSDYCDACAYKWNRRYGEGACPFNSLYWDFFHRH